MSPVLRDACDNCHRRKTRCVSRDNGSCVNCKSNNETCTYSPKSSMGRPRGSRRQQQQRREASANARERSVSNATVDRDTTAATTTSTTSQPSDTTMAQGPSSFTSPESSYVTPPATYDGVQDTAEDASNMPISTFQTNDLMSLDGNWYTDFAAQPMSYPTPELNDAIPVNTSSVAAWQPEGVPQSQPAPLEGGLIGTYDELSRLLFYLHSRQIDAMMQYRNDNPANSVDIAAILEASFPPVSSLCDITTALSSENLTTCPEAVSSCQLLALLGIRYVVSIYQSAINTMRRESGPGSSTHNYIQAIFRAQTMEIHAEKLERFASMQPQDGDQDFQYLQRLRQIRLDLKHFVETCRKLS